MIFSKKKPFLWTIVCLMIVLLGCSHNGKVFDEAEKYVSSVNKMNIPDDVRIIGLGEATHGNVELQKLKKDVFETLIKNEHVRVFVIEGDFGGGQVINQFIVHGKGTAKEAVYALDYSIYKTEQMIELVQWMHDYNARVSDDEKIYFYGNDMQRYDYSKKGLLDYYEVVNKNVKQSYAVELERASNDTMRSLSEKQLKKIDQVLDDIIFDLQANEVAYTKHSSPDAFAFALKYAELMKQRTKLFLNEGNYQQLRDQYLTDNLQWISEFEADHDKVFFSGHNGHIEKTSASLAGYKTMGSYLDELYGSKYFAIGTDLTNSEFQALNRGSNRREKYKIENHNELVDAFRKVESNVFYIDFDKASESEELMSIIESEQKMINVGDDFRSWQKRLKRFYTIEMIPNKAYDGIILLKEATPTDVMD
ncbi:erythromycin esterase family protein [Hazenella sp. IB182357]|uniref:Erythromycin esterase family protein n=1 Tax=Polycladospora coralii TaxID=2771432 RepID=A0A926RVF4_9BACL|nr:erythromycin esterase family protein [Polycladospora coralii]MBD1373544.1 erythromycin esterase family protein [Polycladospora coralii]MBS7531912.1 erythromycin esterase family protein [Polycladospora coralii]